MRTEIYAYRALKQGEWREIDRKAFSNASNARAYGNGLAKGYGSENLQIYRVTSDRPSKLIGVVSNDYSNR